MVNNGDGLRPSGRGDVWDAVNGSVCEAGQDVGEVVAERDFEASTGFHNREDGSYPRPGLLASDMDPVGAANVLSARGQTTGSPTSAVFEEKLGSVRVQRNKVPAGTTTSFSWSCDLALRGKIDKSKSAEKIG